MRELGLNRTLVLGIDASNIRSGGGVTHLVELLRSANGAGCEFSRVIVWSASGTLASIEDRPWLTKSAEPVLDQALWRRLIWQKFRLPKLACAAGCDVLFVPGGVYEGNFGPAVTMSQNMLPFEWRELARYGWSRMTLKMLLLRLAQANAFCRAAGLVFLTAYARDQVMRSLPGIAAEIRTIPHGIDRRFLLEPRLLSARATDSPVMPLRVIYVSKIEPYKHQWRVVEAGAILRRRGFNVTIELVGPAYGPSLRRMRKAMKHFDPTGEAIVYSGPVSHEELPGIYARADVGLFASSCENMPIILLEAMAAGLPMACSNREPMPALLGNGGVYFDPESAPMMADALERLLADPALRVRCAQAAYERAQQYSWERCAAETFSFLAEIGRRHPRCSPSP